MFNKSMIAVALATALAAPAGFAADNDVKQDTRDIRNDRRDINTDKRDKIGRASCRERVYVLV